MAPTHDSKFTAHTDIIRLTRSSAFSSLFSPCQRIIFWEDLLTQNLKLPEEISANLKGLIKLGTFVFERQPKVLPG